MSHKFNNYQKAATSLVVVVLVIIGWLYVSHRSYAPIPPTKTKNVITYSTPKPSEAPVSQAAYTSTAGPNEPKYISLPSIGAEGFIQKMGIDQDNQVAAPNNVNLAGWYVNSLSPGQAGLSIIDGHVDGLHGPGIFFHLDKLNTGDTFTIEMGNGATKTFKVISVTNVDDAGASTALFSRDNSIVSQLNLITCGGSFDQQSHRYNQRTIVVSTLAGS